jgi:hypothetical protein
MSTPARHRLFRRAIATLVGAAMLGATAAGAEPPTAWLTGPALEKRLAEPVDVYWSEAPLRQALARLSRAERVAVLIDRRVDPGQKLELKRSGLPLGAVLEDVAASRGLGISWLGPVAYLGPPAFTSRVRTLAELRREEVAGLPVRAARKFLLPKPVAWDDFAAPRDLLVGLAAESGIEIFGLDQVPHDLWAAADLPPLSLVERLTLLAGQFGLTFQVAADGSSVALIPVPDDVAIERSYPGGPQPEQLARKWAALLPDAQVHVVGTEISVRGRLEDHERIRGSGRPSPSHVSAPVRKGQDEDKFTGEVSGQLGPLLNGLAARFQLQLRIDHQALQEAGISLEQPVAVTVKDVTVDELFRAVLAKAGCTFRRNGEVIEIRPAP